MKKKFQFFLYFLVILIGCLQIIGHVFKNKNIKGLGAMTASSPLPIVFTTVKDLETFSSDFFFLMTDNMGTQKRIQITPELYSKISGPYNRRNVYGAAIAYGPILDSTLLNSVLHYAICKEVLIKELDLDTKLKYEIQVVSNSNQQTWTLKPNCNVQ